MNIDRYRVRPGDHTALSRHRPGDTSTLRDKDAAQERLLRSVSHLEERLELLNAQNERALLLVFQGMDASGKDGAIKHVMSGVNPLFTEVHMFKQPSSEEMDHSFLWRAVKALPSRGNIGIFDRSYYEDVVVVRVHPELLSGQQLPPDLIGPRHLEGTLRGHPPLRASPVSQRHDHPQVLLSCVEGGATGPVAGTVRHRGQELEILGKRCSRASELAEIRGRVS